LNNKYLSKEIDELKLKGKEKLIKFFGIERIN
jgi:hypothetical protein